MHELAAASSDFGRELLTFSAVLQPNQEDSLKDEATTQLSSSSFTQRRAPRGKTKQFIQNLMFRLRRICNHALLYKGFYSAEQIESVCRYLHENVEGYSGQSYDKVKAAVEAWCDYEIHQVICTMLIS